MQLYILSNQQQTQYPCRKRRGQTKKRMGQTLGDLIIVLIFIALAGRQEQRSSGKGRGKGGVQAAEGHGRGQRAAQGGKHTSSPEQQVQRNGPWEQLLSRPHSLTQHILPGRERSVSLWRAVLPSKQRWASLY